METNHVSLRWVFSMVIYPSSGGVTILLMHTLNQLMQLCTARTAWSDSDKAVRAVHSCNSW